MPMLPTTAVTKAPISAQVTVVPSSPDSVTPMMTTDSPSAMRMNAWHLSARCPPSIVHSLVAERPRPGV